MVTIFNILSFHEDIFTYTQPLVGESLQVKTTTEHSLWFKNMLAKCLYYLLMTLDMCLLSNNIMDYHFIAQGKTTIPNVDDGEECVLTDVSQAKFDEKNLVFFDF